MREFGDDAGKLDAGRPGPDDGEGQKRVAHVGIGLHLRLLEGKQQAPADGRRILQRLQARAPPAPIRHGRNRHASPRSPAPACRN